MATAVQTLQNFIDGEPVDPAERRDRDRSSTRPPARRSPEAPRVGPRGRRPRRGRRARRLRGRLVDDHPGRARAGAAADRRRDRGSAPTSSPSSRRPTPASRSSAFHDDEIPFMVDNLRFFAGAARVHGGQGGRRVPGGLHVDGPARAGRRRRPDRAVELPADDGGLEDRPGAGHRQHDRAQARPDDARSPRSSWASSRREFLPQGRAQRRRPAATSPARRWSTHDDVDMVSLTGSVETGKWIAAHAAPTLKRVHLELGGKAPVVVFDDVDMDTALETIAGHRLLQRRPGLHGGDARARRLEGLRRRRRRPGRAGQGPRDGRHARAPTPRSARSTPRASASASRASSSAGPATPRS